MLKSYFNYFNLDLFQTTNHSYDIKNKFEMSNENLLKLYCDEITRNKKMTYKKDQCQVNLCLHIQYEYLFRFAKQYCDELTIVVLFKEQTIHPELRKLWIEELVTGVNVVALDEFMPQDPSEVENFWDIWKSKLYRRSR